MFSRLVRLVLRLSISYPYLIKFHDFAGNSQEGMKHQMRGATRAQQAMTLHITLLYMFTTIDLSLKQPPKKTYFQLNWGFWFWSARVMSKVMLTQGAHMSSRPFSSCSISSHGLASCLWSNDFQHYALCPFWSLTFIVIILLCKRLHQFYYQLSSDQDERPRALHLKYHFPWHYFETP
jgi:hypothetical protein